MKKRVELSDYRKMQMRMYLKENADRIREYQNNYVKDRRRIDPVFSRRMALSNALRQAIRLGGYGERSCLYRIIGLPWEEFKIVFENTFYGNMTYDDITTFEIDHIIPTHTAKSVEELEKLYFWTNLRALTPEDNKKKGRNY